MRRDINEWHSIVRSIEILARKYSALSKLMSLGTVEVVRIRMASAVRRYCKAGAKIVDVGAGGGDSTRVLLKIAKPGYIVALDPSPASLSLFEAGGYEAIVERVVGVGEAIPLRGRSFDVCTVSFALRDFIDSVQGLKEMVRVSRKLVAILDLFVPTSLLPRILMMAWFCVIVPLLAVALGLPFRAVSKLCTTLGSWLSADKVALLLKLMGCNVTLQTLYGGIAGIILARPTSPRLAD